MEAQILSITHTTLTTAYVYFSLLSLSHAVVSSAALPAPGAVYHYQPILAIIAVFGRYRSTDFLSCSDMGVRVIGLHRSTDFYIVIKNESWGAYYIRWHIILEGLWDCTLHTLVTVATHLEMENCEKSGNVTLVREKSGLPVLCCDSHQYIFPRYTAVVITKYSKIGTTR